MIERKVREGWLGALEEQLGDADVGDAAVRLDLQEQLAIGAEHLHVVPALGVKESLDARLLRGRVQLKHDLRLGKPRRLCGGLLVGRGHRRRHRQGDDGRDTGDRCPL
jgi:hypothetical protein